MIACLSPLMQRHEAVRNFAFWLRHYVKPNSGDSVRMEVNKLTVDSGNVTEAIQKASEIISLHADRFDIPIRDAQNSTENIFRLLENEWNLFHQSAATTHSPVLERGRRTIARSDGGFAPSHASYPGMHQPDIRPAKYASADMSNGTVSCSITPLVTGIAIGAP